MSQQWTYSDLIDLEAFLDRDAGLPQNDIHRRDRNLFLQRCPDLPANDRQRLLACWVSARKEQLAAETGAPGPGERLATAARLLTMVLLGCGLIAGISSSLAFFTYSGDTPVNVFHFLIIFVFSQLGLAALLITALMLRNAGLSRLPAPVADLFSRLLSRLAGSRHDRIGLAALLRRLSNAYGPLAYWPVFKLSQNFMIAFNVGLLLATLLKIATTDLAFGWQSTIQVSAPVIEQIVKGLALPWSWFIPHHYAFPSLAEIEGSRIILKDGVYHLATQDLVSWWPFLVFCLLAYGLLLRVALLLSGIFLEKQALRRINMKRPDYLQIIRRMCTPLLSSEAVDGPDQFTGLPSAGPPPHTPELPAGATHLLLLPEDISAHRSADALITDLQHVGLAVETCLEVRFDEPLPPSFAKQLADSFRHQSGGVLLLQEAWLPPINDWFHLLRQIRAALEPTTPITVVLLGRPSSDAGFFPPSAQDTLLWQRKIAAQGDPFTAAIELTVGTANPEQSSC